MTEPQYKIVFNGALMDGFEQAQVIDNLAQLFQIPQARAAALFSGQPTVVKSGVTQEKAQSYVDRMGKAGARVEMVAMQPRPAAEVASEEPASESAADNPPAVPPAEPATGSEPDEPRIAAFQFHGSGREYFGIWIVNILLTILTLGIYSAWAKVRNLQYFYGNTELEQSSFQYLAKPLTILKGRLIALAALVIYSVVGTAMPIVGFVLALILLAATPWIIIRGLRFHAINSAYRNVRFNFEARYLDALMLTLIWPILNVLCLFLLTPLITRKFQQFLVEGSRYGTSSFQWHGATRTYYRFFGMAGLLLIGIVAAAVALSMVHPALGIVVAAIGYLGLFGYLRAGLANLLLNHSELEGHGFESAQEPIQLAWIFFTNSLLTALTLGLYIPWAKVRLARYRADCTCMLIQGNLDGFVAAEAQRTSALGEELGEAFDVGFSAI